MEGSLEAFSGFRAALGAYYVLAIMSITPSAEGYLICPPCSIICMQQELRRCGMKGGSSVAYSLLAGTTLRRVSRKPLQELLRGADMTKPVLLYWNHQPRVSESAEKRRGPATFWPYARGPAFPGRAACSADGRIPRQLRTGARTAISVLSSVPARAYGASPCAWAARRK
jgi:hypothetical protein